MKKLNIIALVGIVMLALAALALGASDTILTIGSPSLSLSGYTAVELLADGSATVQLIDSSGPTVVRTFYLRDGTPRDMTWSYPSGIDSLYVSAWTSATEVVATPR